MLHFALITLLHFAAIVITFCVSITFCGVTAVYSQASGKSCIIFRSITLYTTEAMYFVFFAGKVSDTSALNNVCIALIKKD